MMLKKKLFYLLVLFLTVGGCSNTSTNKADLDEQVFENGSKLVQDFYKAINGEDSEDLEESQEWLVEKYNSGEYASEEEELFISDLTVIVSTYELYEIQSFNDKYSNEYSDSENSKAKMEEKMLEMKEKFGVKIKN